MTAVRIAQATVSDVPVILEMIRGLAEYEGLSHALAATEQQLCRTLFGEHPAAEVLLAYLDDGPIGFALFFSSYSTFLAQPGIYLEDLYVKPDARRKGAGRALVSELARIAVARGCGRLEWAVLDWNEPSIQFYKKLGSVAMKEWTLYRLTSEAMKKLAEGR